MIGDKDNATLFKRYFELREDFPVEDALIYRLVSYTGSSWEDVRDRLSAFYKTLGMLFYDN